MDCRLFCSSPINRVNADLFLIEPFGFNLSEIIKS